jgi:RNA recognition motif-containing protein
LHPPANSGTPANNAVCITGITDHRLEARDLREIMERHGPVSSVVIKNHFTARFAFCEFHDASSVVRALRNLDGLPRAGDPHGRYAELSGNNNE